MIATFADAVGHPARLVVVGFALTVVVGSALLALPIATESGRGARVVTAVFTATSAVCVTGLVIEDTGGHWSTFGEVVILGLIQVGGFGIMTLASLLGLLVVAVVLTWRFADGYGQSWGRAAYLGVFHAVSAFNNAGFGLYPNSLMDFVADPWICLPITGAVILGGIGFPVLFELRRQWRRPRRWSVHTKITLGMTIMLLLAGWVTLSAAEWSNPGTLGPLSFAGKLLAGFVTAVMPRTAGFNSLDVSQMGEVSLLVHDVLMFIGRLGPITAATALALRERTRRYELPEERPIVG